MLCNCNQIGMVCGEQLSGEKSGRKRTYFGSVLAAVTLCSAPRASAAVLCLASPVVPSRLAPPGRSPPAVGAPAWSWPPCTHVVQDLWDKTSSLAVATDTGVGTPFLFHAKYSWYEIW